MFELKIGSILEHFENQMFAFVIETMDLSTNILIGNRNHIIEEHIIQQREINYEFIK